MKVKGNDKFLYRAVDSTGPAKGYGSFPTAWRTLEGIEAVNMIRKGRVRWVPRHEAVAAADFINELFDIAA